MASSWETLKRGDGHIDRYIARWGSERNTTTPVMGLQHYDAPRVTQLGALAPLWASMGEKPWLTQVAETDLPVSPG
jgi:hypothetical protein